jgi:uncharacterized protein (TIGR02246 family)
MVPRRLLLLSLLPVLAARAAAEDPGIRVLIDQLNADWNRHDLHAFAALFEPDASLISPTGTWWHGREEIERELTALHKSMLKNSRMSGMIEDIRMIRPDVALVEGIGEDDTGIIGADGRKIPAGHAVFTYVLVKQRDGWRIASYHLTLLPQKS